MWVVPPQPETLADPDKLLTSVRSLVELDCPAATIFDLHATILRLLGVEAASLRGVGLVPGDFPFSDFFQVPWVCLLPVGGT